MLLSGEIVHFLFFRDAFGAEAWRGTSATLFYSSIALPGMACSTVVMRALFARSLPRQAMAVTASNVAGILVFSVLLISSMKLEGIALAGSLAFTLSSCVGLSLLRRSMRGPLRLFSARWGFKVFLCTLTMLLAGAAVRRFLPYPASASLALRGLWLFGVGGLCALLYGAMTLKLHCGEWKLIFLAMKKKKR